MALTHSLNRVNETILSSGGDSKSPEVLARIALSNHQFKRAETLFVQQGRIEDAILMYLRLHKWREALLVAQANHHPREHAIRSAYFNYLVKTKQANVAGELKEAQGDYATALRLYLAEGYPVKAADLVIAHDMTEDTNLCQTVAQALLKQKAYEKAGQFMDTIRLHQQALEAYTRGHCYPQALDLARRAFPSEVVTLEEKYGDYLVAHKQMDAATNHYIQAGTYLKAINAALEARQWVKAVEIIDQMDSTSAKPYYKRIAKHYVETKEYQNAERYFIQGGLSYDAVIMYTNAQLWDKAHQLASTYLPPAEVTKVYVTLAQDLEDKGNHKDAERLYLTVREPDLAISMYKKAQSYDNMLRLVRSHRGELLVDCNLHLAHQFEMDNNFKQAEGHFLAGNDWKAAVNMYRENELWEDCLRVAKARGGDEAYKQMAYAFAMSVGGDQGAKILQKRGLAEHAVDYAIDRSEFTEAFAIAQRTCQHKLPEVHLQYALALEDDENFEKAEQEFLAARKPKEAIAMWVHQQNWTEAMRVAEAHDQSAIMEIWEDKARKRLEAKDFTAAEECFIAAKKPEEAVKAYKQANMWEDAMRVAREQIPRMLQQLMQERTLHESRAGASGPQTVEYLVSQAKMFEQQMNYTAAIQRYLTITSEHTQDTSILLNNWQAAALLAIDHIAERDMNQMMQVIGTISRRMCEIGRHQEAANIWLDANCDKEAIEVYLQGNMFEEARALAQRHAPQFLPLVNQRLQEHLMSGGGNRGQGGAMDPLARANPSAAIEVFIKRQQWDRVYELAAQQGEGQVQRYLVYHAVTLMKENRFLDTLRLFNEKGMPVDTEHFHIYLRLCKEVFSFVPGVDEKKGQYQIGVIEESHTMLREIMFKFVSELQDMDPQGTATRGFQRFLQIAHLLAQKPVAFTQDLRDLHAKICVSLLRHTVEVPVDLTFYEAGEACRENNWLSMAFVLLNRFSDICDVIDDPDTGDIDNGDFLVSDIPTPVEVPLPETFNVGENEREEVSDWLITKATSAGAGIEQALATRPCHNCNDDTYIASLRCHSCQIESPACIVTGYPVLPGQQVQCRTCQMPANRRDWNAWVSKTGQCPWCKARSIPSYT
jgi:intraflagellar transport protein 172